MIGNIKFRFQPGILSFMFVLLLLSGCIAENNDDCFRGVPLQVKLPAGILSETMQDINIYVFDGSDRLLDILPIRSLEPVILSYPGIPSLHCIAWGNTQDGTMYVSPLKNGRSALCRFHFFETLCRHKGTEEHFHLSHRFILWRA